MYRQKLEDQYEKNGVYIPTEKHQAMLQQLNDLEEKEKLLNKTLVEKNDELDQWRKNYAQISAKLEKTEETLKNTGLFFLFFCNYIQPSPSLPPSLSNHLRPQLISIFQRTSCHPLKPPWLPPKPLLLRNKDSLERGITSLLNTNLSRLLSKAKPRPSLRSWRKLPLKLLLFTRRFLFLFFFFFFLFFLFLFSFSFFSFCSLLSCALSYLLL